MPLFADGDCFARAARSAGTAGPKPLDNPTVGLVRPHDTACGRWCWCARECPRTRCVAKNGTVLAQRWRQAADGQSVPEQLTDAPRSGAPATHTPEQICAVIAMTCEKPSDSERPISHSSQRDIADEAIRPGLVPSISQRSVGRFLEKSPISTRIASVTG